MTGSSQADIDIVPPVREYQAFDFDAIPEMYELGKEYAEAALPEIERLRGS